MSEVEIILNSGRKVRVEMPLVTPEAVDDVALELNQRDTALQAKPPLGQAPKLDSRYTNPLGGASRTHKDIESFASQKGFTVTSGYTKTGHNEGSLHYQGYAADIRTKNKSYEEVQSFIAEAEANGFRVVDERVRPKGQKVWTGPHLHLEVHPAQRGKLGQAQSPQPQAKTAAQGKPEAKKSNLTPRERVPELKQKLIGIPKEIQSLENKKRELLKAKSVSEFKPITGIQDLTKPIEQRELSKEERGAEIDRLTQEILAKRSEHKEVKRKLANAQPPTREEQMRRRMIANAGDTTEQERMLSGIHPENVAADVKRGQIVPADQQQMVKGLGKKRPPSTLPYDEATITATRNRREQMAEEMDTGVRTPIDVVNWLADQVVRGTSHAFEADAKPWEPGLVFSAPGVARNVGAAWRNVKNAKTLFGNALRKQGVPEPQIAQAVAKVEEQIRRQTIIPKEEPPMPGTVKKGVAPLGGAVGNKAGQLGLEVDDVAKMREAAKVTGGGLGGKQRGAVAAPTVLDAIRGAAQGVAKRLGKATGIGSVSKVGRALFGSSLDKLNGMGPAGRVLSRSLDKVFLIAENHTARLGFRIKEAVKANYGRFYGVSGKGRTALGLNDTVNDIVTKVERGNPLSVREKRVWDVWVGINKEFQDLAAKHRVFVKRTVGAHPPEEILKGTEAHWVDDTGNVQRGTISSVGDDSITVTNRGGDHVLETGAQFETKQLADPETYFPRELKRDTREALAGGDKETWDTAINHLVKSGKVGNRDAARRAINQMLTGDFILEVPSPSRSRLRLARGATMFPEEFYNRNFLEVAERHIARTSLDIAASQVWGKNKSTLGRILKKLPSPAHVKSAQSLISDALMSRGDVAETAGRAFASGEGAYQALTKLTSLPTTILQMTQFASSTGILGVKSGAKGLVALGKDILKGRQMIDEIKLSGVIDQDVLSLTGFDDLKGSIRAGVGFALTPMRMVDRSLRLHGAFTGMVAAKDAIKHIKFLPTGKMETNAAYRMLEDWFGYSNRAIERMAKTGTMTQEDKLLAMAGGVKTQVRARPIDLPPTAQTPWGKMLLRMQTFNYGQSKIFGWAVKETTKGNFTPLLRMMGAAAVVGEGVAGLRDEVFSWFNDEEPKRFKELSAIADKWSQGEYPEAVSASLGRIGSNILEAGSLGLYGWVADKVKSPWKDDTIPAVDTAKTIVLSIAYGSDTEGGFLDKLGAAFAELSTKEVVIAKQVYKKLHGGKTYRQKHPIKKADEAKKEPLGTGKSSSQIFGRPSKKDSSNIFGGSN